VRILQPFYLEDFFDQYEHVSDGRINLASSDALPWTVAELRVRTAACETRAEPTDFSYPDIKGLRAALATTLRLPMEELILPTAGAAEGIALVMHELAARLGGSGKVAIPAPSYGAFEGLARLLGLQVATYRYDRARHWNSNPTELVGLAGECDAVVVLNPHNPTGQNTDVNVLQSARDALVARDGTLVVDEVFRDPDEEGSAHGALQGPHVVRIGSLSKMYGLPGLRLGWVTAEPERLRAMRTVQQYLTLSPAATTVAVARPILRTLASFSRGALIRANRETLVAWAASHSGILTISDPVGGTTVVMEPKGSREENLLFDAFIAAGVLLVPGSRFGGPSEQAWFRLGYGTDAASLREGLDRVAAALRQ
jgi:aspartate/methionine/tyrosine aminotransferase